MNGSRLRAAEPAVERDQLLEGAAFVHIRVVEAADHEVCDVREAVRTQQVVRRCGREVRQRVIALDPPVLEVVRSGSPERQRAVLSRTHEDPADVWMLAQGRQQARVPFLDLLLRQPSLLFHEVHEAEVARAEHDDLPLADLVLSRLSLAGCARRLTHGQTGHRGLLVAAGNVPDIARLDSDRSTSSSSP